jgi:hypothetical protein
MLYGGVEARVELALNPGYAGRAMHHKQHRPKSARAGCLMCKPHKRQGAKRNRRPNMRFGALRRWLRYSD